MAHGTGERRIRAFAPGRSEIAGNHVDHQGGRVVSGALTCGISAEAMPCDEPVVTVESEGFEPFSVRLDSLERREDEVGTSAAIVRGMAAQMAAAGVEPSGFTMKATSTIPAGGGLSSSAAFELAVGQVMNLLCADGRIDAVELAKMGKAAECDYFGKPCGLQDQLAIASGGINLMNFFNTNYPKVESVPNTFAQMGLAVCLVDVGWDHSANNADFASIPQDMGDVAALFGSPRLANVLEQDFYARLWDVRRTLGDSKALRAMHYFQEVRLVDVRAQALRDCDAETFLQATRQSGASSAEWLRNVVIPDSQEQPAAMALALAQLMVGQRGAARIHGGGFGGSIQAFVPLDLVEEFTMGMELQFGEGSVNVLEFSEKGAWAQWM